MFSWVTDNLFFFPISHPNLTRDGSFHGPTSEGTILTLLPQVPLPRAPEAASPFLHVGGTSEVSSSA